MGEQDKKDGTTIDSSAFDITEQSSKAAAAAAAAAAQKSAEPVKFASVSHAADKLIQANPL